MIGALFFSVFMALLPITPKDQWTPATPECETIEDLNPAGPLFDMLDWTTPDADIRSSSHMASAPGNDPAAYVCGTVATQDRITYLKTMSGDTWDVVTVDDVGLWAWRTEYRWNQPRSFTQFRRMGTILHAPRMGRGGYPGMRWINCDTAYAAHGECGQPTKYGHLGYVVSELYGPYDFDPGWGDVRGVPILKLVYWYGCSAPTTDSCTTAEVTWTTQRYGQIAWRQYDRKNGAMELTSAPPITVYVVPGVIKESFPCDGEIK